MPESWVCEEHPDQPAGHLINGTPCGGAAMPADDPGSDAKPVVEWDELYASTDDAHDAVVSRCFLYEAGVTNGEPCWGPLTPFPRVIPADEGAQPGDVLLCEGHAPIYRGEPYQPQTSQG